LSLGDGDSEWIAIAGIHGELIEAGVDIEEFSTEEWDVVV